MYIQNRLLILIIVITIIIGSFFIGRATINSEIRYIKGETITNTVQAPIVSKEYHTSQTILPMKPDTQWQDTGRTYTKYITMKVDTAGIIRDYTIKREYNKVKLFDDNKNGKLTVDIHLQYNKLTDNINYDFTPIQQIIQKEKLFTPYVETSWNSFGYVGVGGGIYYHSIGVGAKYITNFKDKGFEINTQIKF